MAEKKETNKVIEKSQQEWLNEKIPFRAFKDNDKYKDDICVGINGKNWVIQRGVQVFIPRFVYFALEDAERQKASAANISEKYSNEFETRKNQLT